MSDEPLDNRVLFMIKEALNFSMTSVLDRVCNSYGFEEVSSGWQRQNQLLPVLSIINLDDIVVTYDSQGADREDYVFRFSIEKREVEMTYVSENKESTWKKYRIPQVGGDFMLAFSELVRNFQKSQDKNSGILINMLVPGYDLYSVLCQIIDQGDLKEQFEKSGHTEYMV